MQYLSQSKSPWLTYDEFIPKFSTAENFRQMKSRGDLRVWLHHGVKYVEFDSMPPKYREMVKKQFGDPAAYIAMQPLKALAVRDEAARKFYIEQYVLPNGQPLPINYQLKYGRQADWLGGIKKALTDKRTTKDMLGINIAQLWQNFSTLINNDEWCEGGVCGHDLPTSVDRLQRRYKAFRDGGYGGIVEAWRFGNDYARKVSGNIERLLLSLYCQSYKPTMAEVCKDFKLFQAGRKQVVDLETGELFEPKDFFVKEKPYMIGESTVDYYIKKPVNEAVMNKGRMKALDYNTQYRPSVARKAPMYSLSKITMDDIDLPFKGPDGDRVVKSYQVFDVCSGAVIGVSFSKDKNVELIREALRDMFRLILKNNWGMPFEIEFEKHLTSAMSGGVDEDGLVYEDILTPGAVFPMTRICLGGNAKEKRAEGFIRVKKYGQQKKRPGFQGRFYAKLLTNRLNADQKQLRFQYEEIVENEIADIAAHNAELHPKQDLYPGLTRWQVLEQNQNPNLPKFQISQVVQFIGYSTATSIRAGIARVQYGDYALPDWEVMKGLSYNGEITAYYIPDENGLVPSVYLFENKQFMCEAKLNRAFQEAIVEQTDEDKLLMVEQFKRQATYDKMIKEGRNEISQVAMAQAIPVKRRKQAAKAITTPIDQTELLPTQKMLNGRSRALIDL